MVEPPCWAPPRMSVHAARAMPSGSTPPCLKKSRSSTDSTACCRLTGTWLSGTSTRSCSPWSWARALLLSQPWVTSAAQMNEVWLAGGAFGISIFDTT